MNCNRKPAFALLMVCAVMFTGCTRTRMVARRSVDQPDYVPEIPSAASQPLRNGTAGKAIVALPAGENLRTNSGEFPESLPTRAASQDVALSKTTLSGNLVPPEGASNAENPDEADSGSDPGNLSGAAVPPHADQTPSSQGTAQPVRLTGFEKPAAAEIPETALMPTSVRTTTAAITAGHRDGQLPLLESAASVDSESKAAVASTPEPLQFDAVVQSVYRSYPLLQSAIMSRDIAFGQQTGASGAFDTKVKGASENGPLGFYETYRQSLGLVKPTYWGGEVFGGYRIGRGDYQPWYQERQTNGGGEFKAGVQVPLARNREIDDRRAELWKAGLERQLAEPDIQAQLISYVQSGSYAYWDWVAAGEYHRIATQILRLAEERTARIESQVREGFVDPPELTDNLRLVSIRQAKAADTRRKLQQTAAKLSVYLRDSAGQPVIADETQLPGFPELLKSQDLSLESDIQLALQRRPELKMLDLVRRQVQVDYSNAKNFLQPELNAVLSGSQDMGDPTSSKRDKSPLEAEASVYLDVPIERRKAKGKMTETQAKIAQIAAKRRLTSDKIAIDVRVAHAALVSAGEQVSETALALKLAEDLAERERQNQEAGASDLLKVALREQYAVESAEKNVDALKLYFESLADYRAAMAEDQLNR